MRSIGIILCEVIPGGEFLCKEAGLILSWAGPGVLARDLHDDCVHLCVDPIPSGFVDLHHLWGRPEGAESVGLKNA